MQSGIRITDVRAARLNGWFKWVLVKVYTDAGIYGIGECAKELGVEGAVEGLKPLLVGEDPTNIVRIYERLMRRGSTFGSSAGTVTAAISGIEMALWDIKGKLLNTPVYQLLGGKLRNDVRVYVDCHLGTSLTPQGYADRAKAIVDRGFDALKFDLDDPTFYGTVGLVPDDAPIDSFDRRIPPGELARKTRLMEAVRRVVGEEIEIGADLHWYYNVTDAIRLAWELRPLKLGFLEDPIPPENVDALKKVAIEGGIPILTGERLYTAHQFRPVIEAQAADIVSPEITRAGGIGECKKVADLAQLYYINLAPHNTNSWVATMALVHLCAAIPNFYYLEFRYREDDWWDDLVRRVDGKPLLVEGRIPVSEAPGLGLELNEEMLARHLMPGHSL